MFLCGNGLGIDPLFVHGWQGLKPRRSSGKSMARLKPCRCYKAQGLKSGCLMERLRHE